MNPVEALTNALFLALTAPSDGCVNIASQLADHIARGLTDAEIDTAKEVALLMANGGKA
jgi:hypothetical protein